MKRIILIGLISVLMLGVVSAAYATTEYTERLGGADRIETSLKIFDEWASDDYHVHDIFLCTSENYPDALAVASLAGLHQYDDDGPILINPSDALDEKVKDKLEEVADNTSCDVTVWLIGGTGALSEDIEDEIEDLGGNWSCERIGGKDRYETAVKVAEEGEDFWGAGPDDIFIVSGENFPDAMSASAFSYYTADNSWWFMPILLVKKNEIPGPTLDWLLAHKNDVDNVYVIGGPGAVSTDVMEDLGYYMEADIERVAGDNRFETGVELAKNPDLWDMDVTDIDWSQNFMFATGANWPDALTGAQLTIWNDSPLLLTSSIDPSIEEYLDDMFEGAATGFAYVLGGTGVISKTTEDDIAGLLSDGDFEPTTEEPEIQSFDVSINDSGTGTDIPDVAQYDETESLTFDVVVDSAIENEDGTMGKVVIEDISECGGKAAPYDDGEYRLTYRTDDGTDWYFDNDSDYNNSNFGVSEDDDDTGDAERVLIKKKSTDPDQREVTFVAKATNQAGSDTMESDSIEIYN